MTTNYSFNGAIEKIQYDDKHVPIITVKGKEYNLAYCSWINYKDKLAVGDSVRKVKDEKNMTLIKK